MLKSILHKFSLCCLCLSGTFWNGHRKILLPKQLPAGASRGLGRVCSLLSAMQTATAVQTLQMLFSGSCQSLLGCSVLPGEEGHPEHTSSLAVAPTALDRGIAFCESPLFQK